MAVVLETSLGDITVDLYTEERPRCCLNFLKLCKIKYYNFCLFHSVQRSLVAQTGDPTGSGKGGESIFGKLYGDQARYFEAEVKPRIKHKKMGTLSMANNGDGKHGAQFFLTLAPEIDYLDGQHTVFGEVAEGEEVLDKFNEAFADKEGRPYKDIRIFHTVVLDDPYDDPAGLAELVPDRSPVPSKEQLESGRIGVDENVDDFEGKTEAEIEEMIAEREAKARTQILEMVGDLPDEDVAPPDNVLFVCKLNPVTTEEDLEIIFSRFGEITSCEVIKEQKTGESLQYAFIEFEKPEDCESAYFKMDNVLIDDRRIHVDFSQSVAKVNPRGKDNNQKDKDDRPEFVIRDRSKKDNYELVFDNDEGEETKEKKHKKKKKHKSKGKDSDQETESHRKSHKHRVRSRSSSPESRRRLSPGLGHNKGKDKTKRRDRSVSKERRKSRSRSRDRKRDRSQSRDRKRDRSRSKDRNRDRSRSKDRKGDKSRNRKDRSRSRSRDRKRHRSRSRERRSRSNDRKQDKYEKSRHR